MTEAKDDHEPTLAEAQAADADAPDEPEAAAEEDQPEEKHKWQIATWKGKPQYGCPHKRDNGKPCRFNTLDLALMTEHIEKTHPEGWLEGV